MLGVRVIHHLSWKVFGNLLLDGFVKDLLKKAEEYIINGWALHYGGAKILTAKKDKELTKKF